MAFRHMLSFVALLAVAGAFHTPVVRQPSVRAATRGAVMMAPPVKEKEDTNVGLFARLTGKVTPTKAVAPKEEEEELSESKKMLQQVKDAGIAGIISYVFWEWAFWGVSVPVCIVGYQAATGHWPDFSNQDDIAKLGAEAFAFVNVARFAIPLRIGLALGTTPWVQANIVDKFQKKDD
uniref:DUF1279 domain-containing protein n=1 Tax=Haptolina ericina TaxID=156174 RepID=A0A7S3BNT6_9EUKA